VHAQIEKGEAMVRDAKALVGQLGPVKKAYEKYCRGLQSLLDVMPKLPENDPSAADLRMRVDGYLEEAERLKTRLDNEGSRGAGTGGGGEREVRALRGAGRDGEPGNSKGKAEGASRDSSATKADAGTRDDKKASGVWAQADEGGGALVQRLERGEALIQGGREAEDANLLDEAYEKYCRGLQLVLEAMPQLPNDHPKVASLKQKVSSYLERAERLKERLANSEKSGARPRGAAQDGKRSSHAGDHGGGGRRARSCSRHRHKHRSPSRSRSHRHGGHDRRRSHSRSRGGRKDAAALPSAASRRTAQSSGRGIAPAPLPTGRSLHHSKAAGAPPDRSKPPTGPPRPSGPAAPLLRPKSGNALLVGKAKASVKR